ncbi:hypothetical protein ACP70R_011803 [Stipagrostis hirtigluma subsp. patula]
MTFGLLGGEGGVTAAGWSPMYAHMGSIDTTRQRVVTQLHMAPVATDQMTRMEMKQMLSHGCSSCQYYVLVLDEMHHGDVLWDEEMSNVDTHEVLLQQLARGDPLLLEFGVSSVDEGFAEMPPENDSAAQVEQVVSMASGVFKGVARDVVWDGALLQELTEGGEHLVDEKRKPLTKLEIGDMLTQVIFRGTHWIRFWSLLQEEEEQPHVKWGCRVLETTAMEIFANNGWLFSHRIQP